MKKGAIAMEIKAVIMECETKRPCEKKVTSGYSEQLLKGREKKKIENKRAGKRG